MSGTSCIGALAFAKPSSLMAPPRAHNGRSSGQEDGEAGADAPDTQPVPPLATPPPSQVLATAKTSSMTDALAPAAPPLAPESSLTPRVGRTHPEDADKEDPLVSATAAYRQLLDALGNDEANRPELKKTPARAAKAFFELTSGYAVADPLTVVGEGIFEADGLQDVVVVRDMPFHSLCEHHLLPFWGTASVAYLPRGRVLGLSKFARLLQVFARRLQLQEKLTFQLADSIDRALCPQAVAVCMEARHACMCMRGVGSPAVTRTVAVCGELRNDLAVREMLLSGLTSSSGERARL